MRCGFTLKLVSVCLIWFAAYAVDEIWPMPVQSVVDSSIAVRQLHSNEAVSLLHESGRRRSSVATPGYALAAIVTIGIGLDSVIARGVRFNSGCIEVEERQET